MTREEMFSKTCGGWEAEEATVGATHASPVQAEEATVGAIHKSPVQEEKEYCGKCGNRFLRNEVEVNSCDAVMVMACMLCGWRKYGAIRSEVGASLDSPYQEIPVETVRGYVVDTRQKNRPTNTFPLPELNIIVRSVCAVTGCDTPITPRNQSGFCKKCASKHNQWVASLHRTPPPFVIHPDTGRVVINPVKSGARYHQEASSC